MSGLFREVLPFALGAMVSPTLLTLQVIVLSSPKSPKLKAWALTLGAAVTLLAYSVLGVTVLSRVADGTSSDTGPHSWTYIVIRGVAGLLLLFIGLRQLRPAPTPGEQHQSGVKAKIATAGPLLYLGVGVMGMLTDFSSLVLYLPALHEITRSDADSASKAVVFSFLFLLTMLPLLLPVLLVTLLGSKGDPVLASLNRFVSAHQRQINAGICLLFSAYLLWTAVDAVLKR